MPCEGAWQARARATQAEPKSVRAPAPELDLSCLKSGLKEAGPHSGWLETLRKSDLRRFGDWVTKPLTWTDDKAEGQRRNDGCVQSSVLITELAQGFCVEVKKQQLELDMEKQTGSKLGK